MSKKLNVLEIPYTDANWRMLAWDHCKVEAIRKEYDSERRATEDYELLGVYTKTGIPYTKENITGESHAELPVWQGLPLELSEKVCESIKNGEPVLVPSGYCNYAPAIVGGVQQALGEGKKVGVVWIDAHCDNVIAEENPDRDVRFVAVPMSTISGLSMHEWGRTYCRMIEPVVGDHVLLGDGRRSGETEYANLIKAGITRVTEEQFEDSAYWKSKVEALAENVDALFMMVDADIMTAECVPAYFRSEPGGHDVTKVMENVRIVMNTGKVAAFAVWCVDFDKFDRDNRIADTTYLNGARVISAGLESWGNVIRSE